jgi:flagellar biosynthesis regulator FlaF
LGDDLKNLEDAFEEAIDRNMELAIDAASKASGLSADLIAARYWDDLFWLVRTGIIEHLRREEPK